MIFVETAGNGLEFLPFNREAGVSHSINDLLQCQATVRRVDCCPVACQLSRRMGVVASTNQETVGTDLHIVANALLAGREGTLCCFVG